MFFPPHNPSPTALPNLPRAQPTRFFAQFVCDTSAVGPKAELLMQINIGCVSGRYCLWGGGDEVGSGVIVGWRLEACCCGAWPLRPTCLDFCLRNTILLINLRIYCSSCSAFSQHFSYPYQNAIMSGVSCMCGCVCVYQHTRTYMYRRRVNQMLVNNLARHMMDFHILL